MYLFCLRYDFDLCLKLRVKEIKTKIFKILLIYIKTCKIYFLIFLII